MDYVEKSIFSKAMNPFVQAGIIIAGAIVIMLLSKIFSSSSNPEAQIDTAWTISASAMLFFTIFNSVFSLSAKEINNYWTRSIISFFGIMLISGLAAYLISGLSIEEVKNYRWIYIVIGFGYLVFVSIIGFMRTIVSFAQKEEWNQPKSRKKRKK